MRTNIEMLNSLPGMIYQYNLGPSGPILTFVSGGSKALTGYTSEELIGKLKFTDILHPEDAQKQESLSQTTLAIGEPLDTIYRMLMKNGEEKIIWDRCKVIDTDDCGMPFLVEGYITDITKMMRIETSRLANSATLEFLAKISMDVRTPLNAIIGMADIGLREDMPDKVREYTSIIKQDGTYLLNVLLNILDYTKIKSNEMEIIPEEYTLTHLLESIVNSAKLWLFDKRKLKFSIHVQGEIPDKLYGDMIRVRQVVLNLLNNAIKFTEDGFVSMVVSGKADGDTINLTFTVEDSGPGIKKENQVHLFEEFTQFDTKAIEGTGLGLSITDKLTSLMNGEIHVTSVFDVGSIFIATLPQKILNSEEMTKFSFSSDMSSSLMDRSPKPVKFIAPRARVLVVDDIDTNLKVAKGLLEPYKMTIDTCISGLDAIEAVKNAPYDLIFMDHKMPMMDGSETVSHIRNLGQVCSTDCINVPIIALTANVAKNMREVFLNGGFSDLLSKPVDLYRLNYLIERWIPKDKQIEITEAEAISGEAKSISIPGIDTSKGIMMTGGNHDKYLDILKTFYNNGRSILHDLKTYADKKDLESYNIKIHAIKSAAGSVGADALSEDAGILEDACEQNNIALVLDKTPKFLKNLKALLEAVGTSLSQLSDTSAPKKTASLSDAPRRKVLVVDDTPTTMHIILNILKEDYEVLVAKNGEIGLSLAKNSKPDLILLDVIMPGMSGFEVLKKLKSGADTRDISVILVSGKEGAEDEAEGYALGAIDYIRKPFVGAVLKHKVDYNISRHV